MANESSAKKTTFCIWFFVVLTSAITLAMSWGSLVPRFIAPLWAGFLKQKSPEDLNRITQNFTESPDEAFLVLCVMIILVVLRYLDGFGNRKGIIPPSFLVYFIYCASVFFSIFMFFISPLKAFFALFIYFYPVLLWHQKKIGTALFVVIAIALGFVSYAAIKMIAMYVLLLPTLHLIAIRANNSLKSRYSSNAQRVYTKLSSTQKNQIKGSIFTSKLDWWEIVEPELDELLKSWEKLPFVGKEPDEKESVHVYEPTKKSLVSIQSNIELDRSIKRIQDRDPNFSPPAFLARFEKTYKIIVNACSEQKIEQIQHMVSDSLYEQFKRRIEEQKASGIKFKCKSIKILLKKLGRLVDNEDFEELHVNVLADIVETAVDVVTGVPLSSDTESSSTVSEFWTFFRRPSAKTLTKPGLLECSCPNCGNPISIGQATVCSVCGSYIRSGNYDWVLSKITQSCEWEYSNPLLVPGWTQLEERDKNLCIQQIEDKAAVIFWIIKRLEQSRNSEPLLRFAGKECYEFFSRIYLGSDKRYSFNESISLASVSLKAIDIKSDYVSIYLLVVWSGIPVRFDTNGRVFAVHRIVKPYRDVMVLTRKIDQVTKLDYTLLSAHCHNCGGPLSSDYDVRCAYCHTILNDGSDWILEKIIKEENIEYLNLLTKKRELIKALTNKQKLVERRIEAEKEITSGRDLVTISAMMLLADGIIDENEVALLYKIGASYEMSEDKVMGVIEAVKNGELQLSFEGKKTKEVSALFDAAVEMAVADGEVCDKELEMLKSFGKKIGFIEQDILIRIRKAERLKNLQK